MCVCVCVCACAYARACVCACVYLCVCMPLALCWLRGPQIEVVQMDAIWGCAEWKCGEVEVVTCGHL